MRNSLMYQPVFSHQQLGHMMFHKVPFSSQYHPHTQVPLSSGRSLLYGQPPKSTTGSQIGTGVHQPQYRHGMRVTDNASGERHQTSGNALAKNTYTCNLMNAHAHLLGQKGKPMLVHMFMLDCAVFTCHVVTEPNGSLRPQVRACSHCVARVPQHHCCGTFLFEAGSVC